jgi:serine/threonine protein kinase, bacterial
MRYQRGPSHPEGVDAVSSGEHTDLRAVLAAGGPLNPARAVNVVRQISAAIDDAHANQTIHRDVTPATIMLSATDYAYLAGIGGLTASADNALLTYQAPELVTNTEVTYRADIYALAAVLYECLTGSPPYRPVTGDAAALIDAHLNAPIPRPSQQRAGIPAGFDEVISRGMAKNPADRYSTARELADATQAALNPTPVSAKSDHPASGDEKSSGTTEVIRTGNLVSPTVSYPHSQPIVLPETPQQGRRLTRGQTVAIVLAAIVVLGLVAAAVLVVTRHGAGASQSGSGGARHTYGSQQPTALPFPGLQHPKAVGVDGAGNVYVLSTLPDTSGVKQMYGLPQQLFKLARDAPNATPLQLPGVDVREATDFAVDTAGDMYLCDGHDVWELATGSSTPIRLPFRGFVAISGIAVDPAGIVYAIGQLNTSGPNTASGAKKLDIGAPEATDLPFAGLGTAKAIAVDKAGNIYTSDNLKDSGKPRVLKFAPGSSTPVDLPLPPKLYEAARIAVDPEGDVFIADGYGHQLYEISAGDTKGVRLPDGTSASTVAIDAAGNLYFTSNAKTDSADKVVKPGAVFKLAPN